MRIDGPTNPLHLARAYGVAPTARPAAPATAAAQATAQAADSLGRVASPRLAPHGAERLVAGVVPGSIDFSGDVARPSAAPSLPLYTSAGALNAAATGVHAGRVIDLSA